MESIWKVRTMKKIKRMPLPLVIKTKYKKDQVNIANGELQIKDELIELLLEDQKVIDAAGECEKCGKPFEIKIGRFGKVSCMYWISDCKNIKRIP